MNQSNTSNSNLLEQGEFDADLSEVVLRTLRHSDEPLGASQLRSKLSGPFRRSNEELSQLLDALVAHGGLHRLAPYKGVARYSTQTAIEYGRDLLVRELQYSIVTKRPAVSKVEARLRDLSKTQIGKLIDGLISEKRLFTGKFLGSRVARISAREIGPMDLVDDALEQVRKRFSLSASEMQEVAREWIRERENSEDFGSRLVTSAGNVESAEQASGNQQCAKLVHDGILELKPNAAGGAMVSIAELREYLHFKTSKSDFDQTIFAMRDDVQIDLHRHNHPTSLSEQEQQAIVCDDRGNFYNALSLRRS